MTYSFVNFRSPPSSLPITLCDSTERTCCLISKLAFTPSETGRKSLLSADFFDESKSCPESASKFLATSTVIQDRTETAPAFLCGAACSKLSFDQVVLATVDGCGAGLCSCL